MAKYLNQSGGYAVPFYTILPGIAYNTNLVKGSDVPKNYADLLNLNVPMASALRGGIPDLGCTCGVGSRQGDRVCAGLFQEACGIDRVRQ